MTKSIIHHRRVVGTQQITDFELVEPSPPVRLLVLGAHPDDAEYHAGSFLVRHATLGATIKIVSVTDGRCGHQSIPSSDLVSLRRGEAAAAGAVIGAEYITWDFPDGSLTPSIEVRHAIIREVRSFRPDLILTHRTVDYHPDHRAVAQAVQDASYLVRVPKVVPDIAALDRDPIVAAMNDPFTQPCQFRPDFVIDGANELPKQLAMMDAHRSQFYDWLPWIERLDAPIAMDDTTRIDWLRRWLLRTAEYKKSAFWQASWGAVPLYIEAFEISEYAGQLSKAQSKRLFPGNISQSIVS